MQVTLSRHAQELLNEEVARTGGSPEEVIERALEQLTDRECEPPSRRKTPAEAVQRVRSRPISETLHLSRLSTGKSGCTLPILTEVQAVVAMLLSLRRSGAFTLKHMVILPSR